MCIKQPHNGDESSKKTNKCFPKTHNANKVLITMEHWKPKQKKMTSIKSYKPTWFNSKLGSNPCKHLLNLILTQVWVHVKVVPNNGFDLGLGGSISVWTFGTQRLQ